MRSKIKPAVIKKFRKGAGRGGKLNKNKKKAANFFSNRRGEEAAPEKKFQQLRVKNFEKKNVSKI